MAKKIVLGLALALTLAGCGNKQDTAPTEAPPENKASIGDAVGAIGNLNKMSEASDGAQKNAEALKKLTPINNEQLKSVLPESFGGIAKTSFEISNTLGLQFARVRYEKDGKSFDLNITDGAGEAGSAMFGMTEVANALGAESETQSGYTKPFTMGNFKGSEKQDKSDATRIYNEVTLLVANRFIVTVGAINIEMDALKTAIKDSQVLEKLEAVK